MFKKFSNKTCIYAIFVFIGAFIFCASTNLIGPLLSSIMDDYNIKLTNGGAMSLYQYAGGTLAIFLSTFFMDKVKKPYAAMVCYLGTAAAFIAMGIRPPFVFFLISYLIFGAFNCVLDSVLNALLSDLFCEERTTALNLLHGITGMGGTFMPILSGFLIDHNVPWNTLYLIVAGMTILIVIALFFSFRFATHISDSKKSQNNNIIDASTEFKTSSNAQSFMPFSAKTYFKDRYVWLIIIALLGFGFYQSGALIWSAKFTEEIFKPNSYLLSALAVSAIWFGTSISRLLQGFCLPFKKIPVKKNLIFGGLISGILLLLTMICHSYALCLILFFLSAACSAGALPQLLSLINSRYPNASGFATGFPMMALYIAYATVPTLMANYAGKYGINGIMIIPAAGMICSALVSIGMNIKKSL